MELNEIITKALDNASRHSWKIAWDKSEPHDISVGESIALCHSELSEALDSYRHNDMNHFSEEMADEIIRICHMCGDLNIDLEAHIKAKMDVNKTRPKNNGKIKL